MQNLLFTICLLLAMFCLSAFVGRFSAFSKRTFDTLPFSQDLTTVIKGFSIVIILTAHIGNRFGVRYLTPLGAWGVSLFLFFSGFGLMKSAEKRGVNGYWGKRIKTALLPYLLVELFGIAFLYEGVSWYDAVKALLLIEPLHPLGWYMQCLFLYYAAFYLSTLLGQKSETLRWLILVLAALGMFLCLRSLFKQQVFSFVLGVLAARCEKKAAIWIKKTWVAPVFAVFGVALLGLRQISAVRTGPQLIYYSVEALQTAALMIATIAFFAFMLLRCSPYLFLGLYASGRVSFELYLTHIFLMPGDISAFWIVSYFVCSFVLAGVLYEVKRRVFSNSGVGIKR